jgi:hypothetical protein
MQSPFIEATETPTVDLDALIAQALAAKEEAGRQKAIYDSLRDQICAVLRDKGDKSHDASTGKARLKETKSGWTFSDETLALADKLKNQQEIEKRMGIAQPSKVTVSADVFPLG